MDLANQGPRLASLPDCVLARIVQATEPQARRQLRLTCRALRPIVDACAPSLTLSACFMPYARQLPQWVPGLQSVTLALGDIVDPTDVLSRLSGLGLTQLPHLKSLTLALSVDHVLSHGGLLALAAAIPPSTTRLVLTHTLPGSACPAPPPTAARVASSELQPGDDSNSSSGSGGASSGGSFRNGAATTAGRADGGFPSALLMPSGLGGGGAARSPRPPPPPPPPPQLDLPSLRRLLSLCPQLRTVRLEGGCWLRSGGDVRALAALAQPAAAAAAAGVSDASAGGDGVAVECIRGLHLAAAADGLRELPYTLAALSGLRCLDVQLLAPPPAAAAGGGGGLYDAYGGGAAAEAAYLSLASEQLRRGLAAPALQGLTRLTVCQYQGSTPSLLEALCRLPLLAQLGMSGLDDAPYITDAHLRLLARLPRLTHLAVDRLDIRGGPPAAAGGPGRPAGHPGHQHYHQQQQHYQQQQEEQQQHYYHHHQQQQQHAGVPVDAAAPGTDAYGYYGAAFADAYGGGYGGGYGEPYGGGGALAAQYPGGGGGGTCGLPVCLPGLTCLEVALVAHSVPRMHAVFPNVTWLRLRWLWEQAMRKVAGWGRLTSLSLANLDCCLDWGLLRTLTGLTELQLCRGGSYAQLAELLYLLRSLPSLALLRLAGWHCPAAALRAADNAGRSGALGTPRGRGLSARDGDNGGASGGGGDDEAAASRDVAKLADGVAGLAVRQRTAAPAAAAGAASGSAVDGDALSAAFAALDPELHAAWAAIRAAAAAPAAAAAALSLLSRVPSLTALELSDCAAALLRGLAEAAAAAAPSTAAAAAAGAAAAGSLAAPPPGAAAAGAFTPPPPSALSGLRELRLSGLSDVLTADVEAAAGALPGLRRLEVVGCWPLGGRELLASRVLAGRGVDVVWRP